MYPLSLWFEEACARIEQLSQHGHTTEALVVTMGIIEKILRRTLKQLMISAGFTNKIVGEMMNEVRWITHIKKQWRFFDPENVSLQHILSNTDWTTLKNLASKRNEIIHGIRIYNLDTSLSYLQDALGLLDTVHITLQDRYGYSGWWRPNIRTKSTLHSDPLVRINT